MLFQTKLGRYSSSSSSELTARLFMYFPVVYLMSITTMIYTAVLVLEAIVLLQLGYVLSSAPFDAPDHNNTHCDNAHTSSSY